MSIRPTLSALRRPLPFRLRAAALFIGAAVAVANPVLALRPEFVATFEGKRLSESVVCFFPAAAEDDGFFKRFLSSNDVRCLSADVVIQMPHGNWNIFVENGLAYISTHPTVQVGGEESEEARHAYREIPVAMQRAATLRFPESADRDLRPVAYFHNLGRANEPPTIRPPKTGENHVLVPASTPVVPLLVHGTDIVRVGEPVVLEPGKAADATFPLVREGRRDIVMLMALVGDVEEESDPADALDLHIESGGMSFPPLLPSRTGLEIHHSLAIFRDVPQAPASLVVGGTRWGVQRIPIPPSSQTVQVLPRINLWRHGELEITWELPDASAATPCRKVSNSKAVATPLRLTLERCDDERPCETLTVPPPQEIDTGVVYSDLAAGRYRVTLNHAHFGSVSQDVEVKRGKTARLDLALQTATIHGSVKFGDHNFLADVVFATGEATTDASGQYMAILARASGLDTVSVLPCDGSEEYIAVPKEALKDGAVFDIVIPTTIVNVEARDAQDNAPVESAAVSASVLFDRDGDERFFLDAKPTDKDGATSLHRVSSDVWLRICAYHRNYDSRCTEALKLAPDEEKTIRLALVKREHLEGRIVTDGPIRSGRLYWIAPTGAVLETCEVAEDGTFLYSATRAPLEYVVFVAMDRPLQVLRNVLAADSGRLEIALPPSPVRDVTLVPRSLANARIALEIDGLLVPSDVLWRHQLLRKMQAEIQDGQPLRITSLASHDLVVLVGPPTNILPPGAPRDTDLSTVPQFRALYRRVPATSATIEIN